MKPDLPCDHRWNEAWRCELFADHDGPHQAGERFWNDDESDGDGELLSAGLPVKPQAEPVSDTPEPRTWRLAINDEGYGVWADPPDREKLAKTDWPIVEVVEKAAYDAAVELLRRWLRVNELPGTRAEISPEIEKARSASYAFLAAQEKP